MIQMHTLMLWCIYYVSSFCNNYVLHFASSFWNNHFYTQGPVSTPPCQTPTCFPSVQQLRDSKKTIMLTNIVLSMEPGGPIQIPTGKKTYINHILVELSHVILNKVIQWVLATMTFSGLKPSVSPSNVAQNANPGTVLETACPEDSKTPPTC